MNMIILTYVSEIIDQKALVAMLPQFWAIPFLVWLRFVDTSSVSKWTVWLIMTVFLGNPYGKIISLNHLKFYGSPLIINSVPSPSHPGWMGVAQLKHCQKPCGW